MQQTRYNSPRPMIPTFRHWSAVACVLLLACLPASADNWTQPVAQLAREILAATGPGAASLSLRNISSLPADQVPVIRGGLETQLRAGGVRIVSSNSGAAEIRVTLSEDLQGYVWVAEVVQGSDTRVALVSAPRTQSIGAGARAPSMVLRKALLWSQEASILDVALVAAGGEPHMIVLDPDYVTLYKSTGGQWRPEQGLIIGNQRAWPRDLRGRLVLRPDHLFDAYLPGMVCASSAAAPMTLNCREGDDPWPLAGGTAPAAFFGASRNFFTGVLTPGIGKLGPVPAFYSAAALPRANYTLWLFARTDGSFHLTDGVNDIAIRGAGDWGSDVAAVSTGCGAGTQLLASGAGDGTMSDSVRAFEIADREPVQVSPALDLPGPITALWPAADAHTAMVVAHNLRTKRYDAFELSISCGQ